jgi:hypothetical protein
MNITEPEDGRWASSPRHSRLCGPFDTHINFVAQCHKIDRLRQKRLGATIKRLALSICVAIRW